MATHTLATDVNENPAKRMKTDNDGHSISTLESLSQYTVVVADTGEFDSIKEFNPQDATTNPSLILKAAVLPKFKSILDEAVKYGFMNEKSNSMTAKVDLAMDYLAVSFGKKISELIPGYVSTEVDARLSFDTTATIAKAHRIISMVRDNILFLTLN